MDVRIEFIQEEPPKPEIKTLEQAFARLEEIEKELFYIEMADRHTYSEREQKQSLEQEERELILICDKSMDKR